MYRPFDRRRLLRGLGAGAALLTPFVRHRLAAAAPAGNLFVFVTPNGFYRTHFGAVGTGTTYTFKKSLAALEPFRNDITVIRGLCNKSSSTFNSHEDVIKLLTCRHGTGDRTKTFGPSLDQVLGKHLGQRPLTLGVPPIASRPGQYEALSWIAAGASDPYLLDPVKAFDQAFGAPAPGDPTGGALARLAAKRKSVLDFVKDDVATLKARLAGPDAQNLDLYLGALREVETELGRGVEGGAPLACDRDAARQRAAGVRASSDAAATLRSVGEAMLDVATAAFACGTRRVATLIWQKCSGGTNPLGGPSHHDVSHGAGGPEVWAAIDAWYAQRFAHLVQMLKKTNQLDHTIAVWTSEISENHNQNDCVFVVAGGRSLGFRPGQSVVYPYHGPSQTFQATALRVARDPRHRAVADLWVSVQKAMGLASDTFGDPEYSTGGLKEIYAG